MLHAFLAFQKTKAQQTTTVLLLSPDNDLDGEILLNDFQGPKQEASLEHTPNGIKIKLKPQVAKSRRLLPSNKPASPYNDPEFPNPVYSDVCKLTKKPRKRPRNFLMLYAVYAGKLKKAPPIDLKNKPAAPPENILAAKLKAY